MVDRLLLKRKAETLTDSEVEEVLEYISIMESLNEQRISPDPLDEAILRLLAEAMKGMPTKGQRTYCEKSTLKH